MGLGKEDLMHIQFASIVRGYDDLNQLNCLFWSYSSSGEKRTLQTGALLKKKGLKKGIPDFSFKYVNKVVSSFSSHLHLEFKVGKNKQTPEQEKYEKDCELLENEFYYTPRSVEEGLNILKKHEILKI